MRVAPADPFNFTKERLWSDCFSLGIWPFFKHSPWLSSCVQQCNPYLRFACLFSLSAVHPQVFADKISRDGCSTYCQLMFLVTNYWENKEHANETFIHNVPAKHCSPEHQSNDRFRDAISSDGRPHEAPAWEGTHRHSSNSQTSAAAIFSLL